MTVLSALVEDDIEHEEATLFLDNDERKGPDIVFFSHYVGVDPGAWDVSFLIRARIAAS